MCVEGGWYEKNQIKVWRAERQTGESQKERAGVGNPPLHLPVVYSFMLGRRQTR